MKEKMLISFSGGETSAYMTHWLWSNMRHKYDMEIVFANTGQENEETLEFVEKFSKHHNFPVTWIEAIVYHGKRKGNGFKIVDFKTASRNGEPFEEIIKKHGIPNRSFPHCSRELKLTPIQSYAKSLNWKHYFTAIGIRPDEMDRVNPKRKERRIVYPLIEWKHMTKQKINFWFGQQPFRLNLKGYQGNCITCWKKSQYKLSQIAKENPKSFEFFSRMEEKYSMFTPERRIVIMKEKGTEPQYPILFFRGNKSVKDILQEGLNHFKCIPDDSITNAIQLNPFDALEDDESCDVFSNCEDQR